MDMLAGSIEKIEKLLKKIKKLNTQEQGNHLSYREKLDAVFIKRGRRLGRTSGNNLLLFWPFFFYDDF